MDKPPPNTPAAVGGGGLLTRLHPACRLAVALPWCLAVALDGGGLTGAVALPMALGLAAVSGLSLKATLGRLVPVNAFMLLLFATAPVNSGGETLFTIGPLVYGGAGFAAAARVALKGNIIFLIATALLGTMDTATLGQAMSSMKFPGKLVALMHFTCHYLELIQAEHRRIGDSMRARAFRPGFNLHTYRHQAQRAATTINRALSRSQRVEAAMRCRLFNGEFHSLQNPKLRKSDALLAAAAACLPIALMLI